MSDGTDIGGRDAHEAVPKVYAAMEKGLGQPA